MTSLLSLNGHLLCSVDCETTGTKPGFHDMIQICVLPLDSNVDPYLKILPFYTEMQPKRPHNLNLEALSINKLRLCNIMQNGLDAWNCVDLFDEWFKNLNLAFGKRIIPLGHNYPFDRAFIIDWLGNESYNQYFDSRYRDTMVAAAFLNDRAEFAVEQIPYPSVKLSNLAERNHVPHERTHDALADAVITAQVYKALIKGNIW